MGVFYVPSPLVSDENWRLSNYCNYLKMYIDDFCRPNVLSNSNQIKKLAAAPLFLCSADPLTQCIPSDVWEGQLYSSREIIGCLKSEPEQHDNFTQALDFNEPTEIPLACGRLIKITMLPVHQNASNKVMYYIQDEEINMLYTEYLDFDLDVLTHNEALRAAISKTVDIMYIDDSVYLTDDPNFEPDTHPTDTVLRMWTNLVWPRHIKGIRGAQIPQYISDNCLRVDLKCSVMQ